MRRNRKLSVCFHAAASGLCLNATTALTVEVYNYASVPSSILANAEEETVRIFHAAGIELSWAACPVSDLDLEDTPEKFGACGRTPNAPVVRIETEDTARRGPVAAITSEDRVWVYYAWIKRNCDLHGVAQPVLLGHVIAHELGHVLLRDNTHTPAGIMIAVFREKELRLAQMGKLLFDRRQAAQMRAVLTSHTTGESAHPAK